MTIQLELTPGETRYLRKALQSRAALINQVMIDSTALDERLELAAQLDLGAELAYRLGVLLQIAAKEGGA